MRTFKFLLFNCLANASIIVPEASFIYELQLFCVVKELVLRSSLSIVCGLDSTDEASKVLNESIKSIFTSSIRSLKRPTILNEQLLTIVLTNSGRVLMIASIILIALLLTFQEVSSSSCVASWASSKSLPHPSASSSFYISSSQLYVQFGSYSNKFMASRNKLGINALTSLGHLLIIALIDVRQASETSLSKLTLFSSSNFIIVECNKGIISCRNGASLLPIALDIRERH